jgi:16S rRNA (uracil1498-N3)-methyltransferase
MQIFYAPGVEGDIHFLDEKESRHCIKVLRMGAGSAVNIIDGAGNLYEGIIDNPDPRKCRIEIHKVIRDFEKRNYRLHVSISPLKNQERFEWFIEKSVEIGIDEITPLICKNTEKLRVKAERLNGIIISAMKQSLKAYKPILNDAISFGDFIRKEYNGRKLFGHCNSSGKRNRIDQEYHKGDEAVIMIGPEGDFSDNEIETAIGCGFNPVHFGNSRLRKEKGGIAACYSINYLNQ